MGKGRRGLSKTAWGVGLLLSLVLLWNLAGVTNLMSHTHRASGGTSTKLSGLARRYSIRQANLKKGMGMAVRCAAGADVSEAALTPSLPPLLSPPPVITNLPPSKHSLAKESRFS